jgi:endonuclease VIII
MLSGIGNLYKAETLFLCGVSPFAPVRQVPDLARVVATAHRLLTANREHPEQSTTGSRRRGDPHWVYDRSRHGCRRCGSPVSVTDQGDPPYQRTTWWCPRCQPLPAES